MAKNPAADAARNPAEGDGPSFEQALERLETIVKELESGTLTLEDSISRYEEGVRLSRRLTQTLDRAEKRIERLTEQGGEPVTEPVELEASDEDPRQGRGPERTPERAGASPRRGANRPAGEELPF